MNEIQIMENDYVILEEGSKFEVIARNRFLFEVYTLEDAKKYILADMKENGFAKVFLQKEDSLERIDIGYSVWSDDTLPLEQKYKIAYETLLSKGYRIQINRYLPVISIDRYRIYDNRIYKEDCFFSQGEEASAFLEEVPEDVREEHWILFEIVG